MGCGVLPTQVDEGDVDGEQDVLMHGEEVRVGDVPVGPAGLYPGVVAQPPTLLRLIVQSTPEPTRTI